MRFLRIAWVILAVLGLDAAGIPYGYARYESVCTRGAEVCSEDSLLTPEDARKLEELGLSRGFYAATVQPVHVSVWLREPISYEERERDV